MADNQSRERRKKRLFSGPPDPTPQQGTYYIQLSRVLILALVYQDDSMRTPVITISTWTLRMRRPRNELA